MTRVVPGGDNGPLGGARAPHRFGRRSAVLSVGVPTYNQCGTLRETLCSLLRQEVSPLEIVVSDNHSTDETRQVLEEFGGAIRMVAPPHRLGMMEHWNYLAGQLRGEWFSLLSSDDEARPGFVRALERGTFRHPGAVLVRAGWENVGAEGEVRDQHYLLSVRRRVRPPMTFTENLGGPKTSFAAFAVRKQAWRTAGGFSTDCRLFGDWAFWLGLAPLGDFIYEREIVAGYRTDYRPGLQLARLIDELADETFIASHVIPETHRAIGKPKRSVVDKALRARFVARLARLGELLPPADRDDTASLMERWAYAANCEDELNRFRRGEQFTASPPGLRAHARPIASALRWPWV